MFMERTRWTIIKDFPVWVEVLARFYFSINFWALSSSFCCIIVASSPSLMIIFSFFYILCTSSSSSRCSAKACWASLWYLIYHLFGMDLLRSISNLQFQNIFLLVLKQCSETCVIIGSRSKLFVDRWHIMGAFAVWVYIGLCNWPHRWVDGA